MRFVATAKHTGGKSISHSCTVGAWDDPTECWEETFEAPNAEAAEVIANGKLGQRVGRWGACQCKRKLEPGNVSWWDSVVVHVQEVSDE